MLQLPKFKLDNCLNIKILQEPRDFYTAIKNGISSATTRIVLASLYIGSTEYELIELLKLQLEKHPSLKVDILVDYFRGLRIDSTGNSSLSLLRPLYEKFPTRITLNFYHTPAVNSFIKATVPPRFIEGFGLQHMKLYVFDNDLLISGANLSKDYFTNRQDRYILIQKHHLISDYFAGVVEIISMYAHRYVGGLQKSSESVEYIAAKLRNHINFYRSVSSSEADDPCDTFLYPSIQMTSFGIKQDADVLEQLLNRKKEPICDFKSLHVAAGYFNLPMSFQSYLLASSAKVSILTSSPMANGFYNSKGLSKYVPLAYNYLLQLFYSSVVKCGKSDTISIFEYERKGWTWHGKGLWIQGGRGSNVIGSAVGSSNYNYRSFDRDLEAQLYIMTTNDLLQKRLKENLDFLYLESRSLTFAGVRKRHSPYLLKIATHILKNML